MNFNNVPNHHKHHHHHHKPHWQRNNNNRRNANANRRNANANHLNANANRNSANANRLSTPRLPTSHAQYLPLYIYILFAVLSIAAQFLNKNLSKSMEEEWRTNKLSVILMYVIKLTWAVIIYMLCTHHHTKTAWFIVFLPFIIIFALVALAFVLRQM